MLEEAWPCPPMRKLGIRLTNLRLRSDFKVNRKIEEFFKPQE